MASRVNDDLAWAHAVVVALVGLPGCGLFVDTQSFAPEAAEDASPSQDATTVHDAASGHDAPGDVRGEDALDAHVVRFCHTVDATFCADFDEGALSEAGFTSIPSGAAAMGLVTRPSRSPRQRR